MQPATAARSTRPTIRAARMLAPPTRARPTPPSPIRGLRTPAATMPARSPAGQRPARRARKSAALRCGDALLHYQGCMRRRAARLLERGGLRHRRRLLPHGRQRGGGEVRRGGVLHRHPAVRQRWDVPGERVLHRGRGWTQRLRDDRRGHSATSGRRLPGIRRRLPLLIAGSDRRPSVVRRGSTCAWGPCPSRRSLPSPRRHRCRLAVVASPPSRGRTPACRAIPFGLPCSPCRPKCRR